MEESTQDHGRFSSETFSGAERPSTSPTFALSTEARTAKERLADHWEVAQEEAAAMAVHLTASFLDAEDEQTQHWFFQNASDPPGERSEAPHRMPTAANELLEARANELGLTPDQFFDAALRLARTIVEFLRKAQLERHEEHLSALHDLLEQAQAIEANFDETATDLDPLKPAIAAIRRRIAAVVSDVEAELARERPLERSHDFV